MKTERSVPKCRHIKFRRLGFTQKKAYNELKMQLLYDFLFTDNQTVEKRIKYSWVGCGCVGRRGGG